MDLKTSKYVYPSHFLQLEGYEAAAIECGYPPTDHRAVIHVTADGRYELALNSDWCFEDFLAVRKIYAVLNERSLNPGTRIRNEATGRTTVIYEGGHTVTCPPHTWRRDKNEDRCAVCDHTYRDLMRGFGSNVSPSRQR